jgi:hypothetical protein
VRATGRDAVTSAYDIETLKEIANLIAYGIDGDYDDPRPGEGTVKLEWRRFLAAFRRKHGQIPRDTTLSVWNVKNAASVPLDLYSAIIFSHEEADFITVYRNYPLPKP